MKEDKGFPKSKSRFWALILLDSMPTFFRSVGESSNMMCAKLYRTYFEVESC
jgi:hypothetical protein